MSFSIRMTGPVFSCVPPTFIFSRVTPELCLLSENINIYCLLKYRCSLGEHATIYVDALVSLVLVSWETCPMSFPKDIKNSTESHYHHKNNSND